MGVVQDVANMFRNAFGKGTLEEKQEAERKKWVKSALPVEVRLKRPDAMKLKSFLRGLWREEYGLPVLCIETPLQCFDHMATKHDFESVKANTQTKNLDGETAKMNTQLVPMQFVAGGGSIWLN